MSGKASGRRPTEVSEQSFADNWSRIFGSDGARVGANGGSNPSNVGAIPTAPAIKEFRIIDHLRSDGELEAYVKEVADLYIDDATGK